MVKTMLHKRFFLGALIAVALLGCHRSPPTDTASSEARGAPQFIVSFPATVRQTPLTGRVLLFLARSDRVEPRMSMNWTDPDPAYAIDVTELLPDEELVFSAEGFRQPDALAFPLPMDRLPAGVYYAQAFLDQDQTHRDFNTGPGNLHSQPLRVDWTPETGSTYHLIADQSVVEVAYEDTDWVKFVNIRSALLSAFHGCDVFLHAAVVLPHGYADEPERHYPAFYQVPGFTGRHDRFVRRPVEGDRWTTGKYAFRGFEIALDPDVPLGHSVFANSANNGPVGDALVTELIPAIEARFRIIPEARARFVGGHSSGGWASLWLQVTYPEFFGGCWSTAPDPVDFRSFQTINIYEDDNGHWTREGLPRPLARNRHETRMSFVKLNHWEYVIGPGGQLDSFNAVFSPRGADRRPRPLMNKLTGVIDREVAEHWKNYDIRLILEERWSELGPKLKGKLHVVAGGWDTFYLEPAVWRLKAFLDTTDFGGYVEIHPGDHGSFRNAELRSRFERELAEEFENGRTGGVRTNGQ
jgi:hypothetical protein